MSTEIGATCANDGARVREHWVICIASLFIPLVGVALGIYGLTQKDCAWRNTGRAALICGVIHVAVGMIVGIAWFVAAGLFATRMVVDMQSTVGQVMSAVEKASSVNVQVLNQKQLERLGSKSPFYVPAKGDKIVLVTITVTNNGKQTVQLSPDSFEISISGTTGTYGSHDLNTVPGLDLFRATLQPKAKHTGTVVFEIPRSASASSVKYRPDFTQLRIPGMTPHGR